MTKQELIEKLQDLPETFGDEEWWHREADLALLEYIDDDEITDAFIALPRWYA